MFGTIVQANTHTEVAQSFLARLEAAIIGPLITLLIATALLVFLWGMFEYVRNAENDEKRKKGREHMLWGIVGLLVMVSALAIIRIVAGTFGISV